MNKCSILLIHMNFTVTLISLIYGSISFTHNATCLIMPKQWFCDCEKHCKGTAKEVSRSTYQRHTRFRKPDFPDAGHSPPTAERETHTESGFAIGLHRTRARAQGSGVLPQVLYEYYESVYSAVMELL